MMCSFEKIALFVDFSSKENFIHIPLLKKQLFTWSPITLASAVSYIPKLVEPIN